MTGVVLLNMGGPDSLEAVGPFMENLFSDPEILRFPLSRWLQRPLARWIRRKRTPKVVERYRQIGGKSPIAEITRAQAAALEAELGEGWAVAVAMRYWHPRARAAAAELRERGADRLVVLPLYPHYSRATTGSSLADLERALEAEGLAGLPRRVIRSWHDHPLYLDALAEAVAEGLEGFEGATVLFSAHSLPQRLIDRGDPYLDHIRTSVAGVVERLGHPPHRLAFQSRTGPVRWLGPGVEETLRELAAAGVERVCAVAVSFVSDHIETLHEIDVEYAELARFLGIGGFRRAPSLNTRPAFIRALAALAREAGEGVSSSPTVH
ncbi:ferrochelatase [Deferrisoma sp.]